MRFPLGFNLIQNQHRIKMKRAGQTRYPTVLMLEPLYTCNLQCLGCSVERHSGKLSDRISPEQCFRAVDDCGAPIVNICGGEPTLYPELPELVEGLYARGKHVILCTNGIRMEDAVFDVIPPDKRLFIMVHLDGLQETHDRICARDGLYEQTIEMIREARRRGYIVYLNTTVYRNTDIEEVEAICQLVDELDVDGILLSPGYEFSSLDTDIFLSGEETTKKFRQILEFSDRYNISATPTFLEFAAGMRELDCAPWSTVNYTPKGWKAPCYLIEGDNYFADWHSFWEQTDWAYWESRQDAQCRQCRMHSGFEHNAVIESMKTLKGLLRLVWWALR
jgi:hopanoid biosynthesis associated radical SAM protein HpnH